MGSDGIHRPRRRLRVQFLAAAAESATQREDNALLLCGARGGPSSHQQQCVCIRFERSALEELLACVCAQLQPGVDARHGRGYAGLLRWPEYVQAQLQQLGGASASLKRAGRPPNGYTANAERTKRRKRGQLAAEIEDAAQRTAGGTRDDAVALLKDLVDRGRMPGAPVEAVIAKVRLCIASAPEHKGSEDLS